MVRPTVVPRIAPDADDDVVIGTALAARADLVVTGDKLLLSVAEHQGLRIVGVRQAALALAPSLQHRSLFARHVSTVGKLTRSVAGKSRLRTSYGMQSVPR